METLQGQKQEKSNPMEMLQRQIADQKPNPLQQIKDARNNIKPFEKSGKSTAENGLSTEIPQSVYEIGEKVFKAPFEIAKKIPQKMIDSTRPFLAQGDESFESLALNWKAKVKGFFSGIANFIKSFSGNK